MRQTVGQASCLPLEFGHFARQRRAGVSAQGNALGKPSRNPNPPLQQDRTTREPRALPHPGKAAFTWLLRPERAKVAEACRGAGILRARLMTLHPPRAQVAEAAPALAGWVRIARGPSP